MSNDIYTGYTKGETDKNGKHKVHIINETSTTFDVKVPAFTDQGKTFVGWGQVTLLKASPENLKANSLFTYQDFTDLNRQRVTDTRNTVARLGDINKAVAKVQAGKASPEEFKQVVNAALKGTLGGNVQAEINKLVMQAMKK